MLLQRRLLQAVVMAMILLVMLAEAGPVLADAGTGKVEEQRHHKAVGGPPAVVAQYASPATAQYAAPTAPGATVTATALPESGGPLLVGPVTLAATLTLIASGVGALMLLRRGVS